MIIYDTIKKYSDTFSNKTLHPLINLVDLNKGAHLKRAKFRMDFYAIIIKESHCGDLRYGNTYYDYAEGTVVFIGPGQVITNEPEGELHQPFGKALVFHPDLIKGTSLGKQMHEYSIQPSRSVRFRMSWVSNTRSTSPGSSNRKWECLPMSTGG